MNTNNPDLDRVLYDLDILFKNGEKDIRNKVEELFNKNNNNNNGGNGGDNNSGNNSSNDSGYDKTLNEIQKAKIADLEKQVAELQKALTMKDEIIDTQKKMIEMMEKK